MSDSPDDTFLSRWSRRKHEVARANAAPATQPPADALPAPVVVVQAPVPAEPLPPVESLTIESDFAQFLAPKVEESVKRAALRKLFSDPHFNVMDGLDTYIGDYTQADPMPEGMLAKLQNVYETLTKEEDKAALPDVEPADAQAAAAPDSSDPPAASAAKDPPSA